MMCYSNINSKFVLHDNYTKDKLFSHCPGVYVCLCECVTEALIMSNTKTIKNHDQSVIIIDYNVSICLLNEAKLEIGSTKLYWW